MEFNSAMKNRRSQYDLSNTSPISNEELETIIKEAITFTPSAFHSQSSRVILLYGQRHEKLWEGVMNVLRGIVPTEAFASTKAKIESFAAAYGTILYFEDMATVEALQKDNPLYKDNFPVWSNQSAGMLQYTIWTSLSEVGFGASLQHYNPLIDTFVKEEFKAPDGWKLLAQMPFGTANSKPEELTYKPIKERLIIQGGE